MGLFDMFSKSPEKKIEKAKGVMLNEHHQAQVRQGAIHDLMTNGTPAAIEALVERLGVSIRDTIQNESEQAWVHDILVDHFKERAVEPLKSFIARGAFVSRAILTLKELVSEEELTEFLRETLRRYDPKDHRTVTARENLVDALGELSACPLSDLTPYTLDHSDDVRVKVMGIIEERLRGAEGGAQGGALGASLSDVRGEVARALSDVLLDPFSSGRIVRAAVALLVGLALDVSPYAERLGKALPDGVRIEGGVLRGV